MKKPVFCRMTGKELAPEERTRVYFKWEKGKEICLGVIGPDALRKLERFKIAPPKRCFARSFEPVRISVKTYKSSKHVLYYIPVHALTGFINTVQCVRPTYRTKDGYYYLSEEEILYRMDSSDRQLMQFLVALADMQEDDEFKKRKTIYRNFKGFSASDASFLTGMAKLYHDKRLEGMTPKRIEAIRNAMHKYAGQLSQMSYYGQL